MFYCYVNDINYAKIYELCTGFEISTDLVSTCSICSHCEKNLLFVFDFKQKILQNEAKLEQLFLLNSEIEKQFLRMDDDDNFFDFRIESLDELDRKELSECKFKALINSSRVKCTTCFDDCQTEHAINSVKSNDSYSINCECDTILLNRESFIQHYTRIHINADKNIKRRREIECNEHLSSLSSAEMSTSNEAKMLKCLCSMTFSNVEHLKEHEKTCDFEQNRNSNMIWKCLICGFKFVRENSLRKHFETAHIDEPCEFIREGIDEFATEKQDEKSSKKLNHKPIECQICGAQFKHRSTKIAHMVRKHEVRKSLEFECTYGCGFKTLKRDRYRAHIDKHENPDKKYNCQICNQEFNSYNTMNQHKARHSSPSLTFSCSYCNKLFLDKRNYNVHLRLHTRENLFYCSNCQRGFSRKDHLNNHLKRKNNCER